MMIFDILDDDILKEDKIGVQFIKLNLRKGHTKDTRQRVLLIMFF